MLVTSKILQKFSNISLNARDKNGFIDLTNIDIQLQKDSREKLGVENREKNWIEFSDGRVFLLKEYNHAATCILAGS